ncbi:MAG: hypothetical protein SFU91_09835 [Chloroherpetonaceae bacterium]|nr:hypothetical protein [Chloroherpetonaceae bacterium]
MKRYFFLFLFLISSTSTSIAQVLGEFAPSDKPAKEQARIFIRSLEFGYTLVSLSPRSTNQFTGSQFNFDEGILSLAIRLDNALIYFDYGKSNTNGETQTLLAGGARFDVDNYFSSPEATGLKFALPISLITDIIFASRQQGASTEDLRLFSLGIGTGSTLIYNTRSWITLGRAIAFAAFATQGFGDFSPQSSGTLTGVTAGFLADVTAHFPNLVNSFGFAFSYRFRYLFSNFSANQFDYFMRQHSFTAGITF